ncbi:MAG: riboflavin synthase [bacterium]
MFTGIIEEIGIVKAIRPIGRAKRITVQTNKIIDDLKVDDSVALNGVCQTVVGLTSNTFDVEAVEETLRKTTLGKFINGKKINLERAAKLGDRMGGHLVQGHVDCVGHVLTIIPESAGKLLWISFPSQFRKYIVPVGSICIDGVSLTVAKVETDKFMVAVIPHTWDVTMFNELKTGIEVNLEFDIIGKYVENMTNPHLNRSKQSPNIENL